MNYLAHAYLSFHQPQLLAGNMAGDFFKGTKSLESLPAEIRRGVMLHRRIDELMDQHPATARAKVWFRPDYRLYSGAVVDSLMDYFLANDPKIFASEEALRAFSLETYALVEGSLPLLPEGFRTMFPYMREHNWLYNYRTLPGIRRALGGLARRAPNMPPVDAAYETFLTHFYELNQCYYELIDDIIRAVKMELNGQPPGGGA